MKTETSQKVLIKSKKQNWAWISVFVFIVVLSLIGMRVYFKNENQNQVRSFGTYDDPKVAFKETQKALLILSTHLNNGIESAQYIQEYDKSKNLIFKEQ